MKLPIPAFLSFAMLSLIPGAVASEPRFEFDFNTPMEGRIQSTGSEYVVLLSKHGAAFVPEGVSAEATDLALDNSATPTMGETGGLIASSWPVESGPLRSFTLTGWIKEAAQEGQRNAARLFYWRDDQQRGIDLALSSSGKLILSLDAAPPLALGEALPEIESDRWRFFALTWSGKEGRVRLFLASEDDTELTPWASESVSLETTEAINATLALANAGGSRALRAKLDNIRFWSAQEDDSGALSLEMLSETFRKDLPESHKTTTPQRL